MAETRATSTAPHVAAPECGSAMNLTVQVVGAIIGFVLTTLFVAHPTPALMALFFFVAQPLFVIVGLMYLARVLRELREKDVL